LNFEVVLREKYLENPCSFQPTALWKTIKMTSNFKNEIKINNNEVVNLIIENESMLHTYWISSKYSIYPKIKDNYEMMILHDNFIGKFNKLDFIDEKYFKLIHNLKNIHKEELDRRFSFDTVDIPREADIVSDIICKCYSDIRVTPEEVLDWTKEEVFDNSLWVFVVDNIKEMPIALGIAECDKDIMEGSLEWIQVLPQYRGYGIGATLINFLLLILKEKSKFVTVSGKVDNKTNPQRMYRKCGFQGNDIWHILRRNL